MKRPVILGAVRTATGRLMGALAGLPATALGARVVAEAVKRSGIAPDQVDEVILGNAVGAGLGLNPARRAAVIAGLPESIPAFTVNQGGVSGLQAVVLAARAIRCGEAEVVVAGGMESISTAPFLLFGLRDGYRLGHRKVVDSAVHDGLQPAPGGEPERESGENVAEPTDVSREERDRWSLGSHAKAIAAIERGEFEREILPLEIPRRKADPLVFDTDETPRRNLTVEALREPEAMAETGGARADGEAPELGDGASALVIASAERAAAAGIEPRAEILACVSGGWASEMALMAPERAIRAVWDRTGWSADETDLYEIDEARSAQQVALGRVLGIAPARHNVRGGSLALGHPVGAGGARILTTLLHALEDRGGRKGIASLCSGGGGAAAVAIRLPAS